MRGDHISVHYGCFYHHGIDGGAGTVIHMSREHGGIVRTSFATFADGRVVKREASPLDYSRDQVLKRALRRVGESGYDLFHNNCEHFVYWCRTGKMWSKQVCHARGAIVKQASKSGLKLAAKEVTKIGTKSAGKALSKTVAKSGAKSGAKVLGKTLAKGGGALLAIDALQFGVEQVGGQFGLSQSEAEVAGKAVGLGGHLAVGATVGGPVGAVVAGAVWGVGELLADWF